MEQQSIQKKKNEKLKKESGVAGTRTHGRGSVPLMSKSDAIPLRHEAETFDMGKTTKYIVTVCSNSNPIYICDTFGNLLISKKRYLFQKAMSNSW